MRYVQGTDLSELLRSEGKLSAERGLVILGDIASALDFAHDHGLAHRDVKPGNVMIEDPGEPGGPEHVFLADFGIVKRTVGKQTREGYFVGTADYVAPELFRGGLIDGRADNYALACVLFKCLTGKAPFRGDSEAAIMFGHLTGEPPSIAEFRPDLPSELDHVISTALAKSPDDRYPTARAMIDAAWGGLRAIAAPVSGGPAGTPAPPTESAREEPAAIRGSESPAPAPSTRVDPLAPPPPPPMLEP